MMNETHELFGACWKMLNAVRKSKWTQEGWEECAKTAREIHKKDGSQFSKQLVLEVLDEAERLEKSGQKELEEYRMAHQIYQATWEFFVEAMNDLDEFSQNGKKQLRVYIEKFQQHPFAVGLGGVVYEAASKNVHVDGDFAKEASGFYEKYINGIQDGDEEAAYREAESIINKHPEYMMQVMEMYHKLKCQSAAAAA